MTVSGLSSVACNSYTLFSTGGGGGRDYVSTRLKTEELEADSLTPLAFWFGADLRLFRGLGPAGLSGVGCGASGAGFGVSGVGCRVSGLGFGVWGAGGGG